MMSYSVHKLYMSYSSLISYVGRFIVMGRRTICWYHNETLNPNKKKYYVVIKGRVPGIYTCCVDFHKQTMFYSNQRCKAFIREEDALLYIKNELDNLKYTPCDESNNSTVCTLENVLTRYKDVWKDVIKKEVEVILNSSSDSLTFDRDGYLEVYTDGSCSSKNALATIGVYFGAGNTLNTSAIIKEKNINSTDAEVKAIHAGLKRVRDAGYRKVKVLTDSTSAISLLTRKLTAWKRDNWMYWNGEFIKDKNIFIEIDELLTDLEVKFVHVSSQLNKADRVARACMEACKEEIKKNKEIKA